MQNDSELFGIPRKQFPIKNSIIVTGYGGTALQNVEFSQIAGTTISLFNFNSNNVLQKGIGIRYFSANQGTADADYFQIDQAGTYAINYSSPYSGNSGSVSWYGNISAFNRMGQTILGSFQMSTAGVQVCCAMTVYLDAGTKIGVVFGGATLGSGASSGISFISIAQVA